MVPENEIQHRLHNLQRYMIENKCECAIIIHKVSLYYFSGCDQDAHLFVPVEGEPLLLVRNSIERAQKDSPIKNIVEIKNFHDIKTKIVDFYGRIPGSIGLELDVVPARYYLAYQKEFEQAKIVDISKWVRECRMIKSPWEIIRIEKAANLGDDMLAYVSVALKEKGCSTELDLAAELEYFYRKRGHVGVLRTRAFNSECFYGHVLSGPAGATPSNAPGPTAGTGMGPYFSQGAGLNPIRPNEPIIVDYTSNHEGYVSDQARTFSLGELPQFLKDAHELMIEVAQVFIEEARPGKICHEIYEKSIQVVKGSKFQEGFMGYPKPVPFLAHGVGLELDELPLVGKGSNTVLKEGMVLALEPKVVLPGIGVVGIENTLLVEDKGIRVLNKFPEDIVVV